MRKINFLFGILAVAATGLLSSCDWEDDESVKTPVVNVPNLGKNTLVVATNVNNATIKLGTDVKIGQNAEFTVENETAKVEVSAAGYLKQVVNVSFAGNTVVYVDVNLVKPSTNQVAQADAAGTIIDNDAENQIVTGIDATMEIPAGVVVDGNTTDDFSVVAYVPAQVAGQSVEEEDDVVLPVLALECTPSGATFDKPITLTATTIDAKDCKVICKNGTTEVPAIVAANGNAVSAEVNHFSVWEFILEAKVTKVVDNGKEVIKKGSILLSPGKNNTITYTQKYGFEATNVVNGGLISNFLVSQFGKAGSVNKSVNIESDKVGSADYTITQAVKTYMFKSGNREFTAKVYGAVEVVIDRTTADTSGHSGGTGK